MTLDLDEDPGALRLWNMREPQLRRLLDPRGIMSIRRWDCPCGCDAFALYGWGTLPGAHRAGTTITADDVMALCIAFSATLAPGPVTIMGIDDVAEMDDPTLFLLPMREEDHDLIWTWMGAGLREALRTEFDRRGAPS